MLTASISPNEMQWSAHEQLPPPLPNVLPAVSSSGMLQYEYVVLVLVRTTHALRVEALVRAVMRNRRREMPLTCRQLLADVERSTGELYYIDALQKNQRTQGEKVWSGETLRAFNNRYPISGRSSLLLRRWIQQVAVKQFATSPTLCNVCNQVGHHKGTCCLRPAVCRLELTLPTGSPLLDDSDLFLDKLREAVPLVIPGMDILEDLLDGKH